MKKKFIVIFFISLLLISAFLGCREGDSGKESPFKVEKRSEGEGDIPVISMEEDKKDKEEETSEQEPPLIVVNTEGDTEYEPIDLEPEEYLWDFESRIFSKETASEEEAVLAFAGDISFAEGYSNMSKLHDNNDDINTVIKPEVMKGIKEADIFMVNNEFPYSNRGSKNEGKTFSFRARPESVRFLKDMEVDIVSLANNHAFDYGEEALIDSMDILKEADIPFVGAGHNISEAMQPVYFKVNKKLLAITSATQIERTGNPESKEATESSAGVLRTLNAEKMVKCIKEAEEKADFVIVFVHWGSENTDLVEASQRELAKKYVEAGADAVIGAHPHCLQGIDYVEGVPVFYSLGNFWFNSRRVDTGYLKLTLNTSGEDCSIKELRFVPCIQNGLTTSLANEDEAKRICEYIQGISNHASISQDGVISYSEQDNNIQNGQNTSPSKDFIKKQDEVPENQENPEGLSNPAALLNQLPLPEGTADETISQGQ